MRLVDLQPEWIFDYNPATHGLRRATDSHSNIDYREPVEFHMHTLTVANAQGVMFLCPACFKKNGGAIGTESVLCWFRDRGVPDDALPGPGRWTASGAAFADLTLHPSVNVDNEHWHGWIQNGEVS